MWKHRTPHPALRADLSPEGRGGKEGEIRRDKQKRRPRRTAFSNIGCKALGARRCCGGTAGLTGACRRRWGGQTAFALGALAGQLAGAAHGLGLLASLLFGGLLIVVAQLHLAEDAFALQLFLQRAQRLVYVIIANDYLQRSTALSKLGQMSLEYSSEAKKHRR